MNLFYLLDKNKLAFNNLYFPLFENIITVTNKLTPLTKIAETFVISSLKIPININLDEIEKFEMLNNGCILISVPFVFIKNFSKMVKHGNYNIIYINNDLFNVKNDLKKKIDIQDAGYPINVESMFFQLKSKIDFEYECTLLLRYYSEPIRTKLYNSSQIYEIKTYEFFYLKSTSDPFFHITKILHGCSGFFLELNLECIDQVEIRTLGQDLFQ